ncbi:MAG TPA: hypothetical protein VFH47_07220 [Candidatus Thermoplasmatota archaeon]|nr:hypothetical protein [Candidatus Thermoplasmatota archaeon]
MALWALAFALRLLLAGGGAYGDEAAHYYMARHGPQDPDNVVPAGDLLSRIWWERPLFSVLLAPGAAFGFLGYRVGHAAAAATTPREAGRMRYQASTPRPSRRP